MSEKTKSPADRLLELIRLEKKDLITLPFLVFAYGVISIATPVSVQALVNVVNMGAVLQPLFVISLILFVLLLLSGALYVFEGFIVELIQRRIYIRTAIDTAQNTQKVEISLYDKENPVELINRFFDVDTIQKSAATLLTISLISLLQVIIGSIILLFYSVYFAFVVMMIIGFLIFIDVAPDQQQMIIFALGFITSSAGQVLSFYFGSSQGSKDKTEEMKGMLKK